MALEVFVHSFQRVSQMSSRLHERWVPLTPGLDWFTVVVPLHLAGGNYVMLQHSCILGCEADVYWPGAIGNGAIKTFKGNFQISLVEADEQTCWIT